MGESAPVSSSSSDSGRGTDSERSPGSSTTNNMAFNRIHATAAAAATTSGSSSHQHLQLQMNNSHEQRASGIKQMPWRHVPAATATTNDNTMTLDMNASWAAAARSQDKQLIHAKAYPIRDIQPRIAGESS